MFLPPTMRWYSFWDDSGQFHHLPSVTTILDVTMAPARRSRLTQAIASRPLASTRQRQAASQRGDRLDQWFKACCQQGKPLPNPAANSNPTSPNYLASPTLATSTNPSSTPTRATPAPSTW
jgi:hypothetical protein